MSNFNSTDLPVDNDVTSKIATTNLNFGSIDNYRRNDCFSYFKGHLLYKPERVLETIYERYETLNTQINRIFEVASSIIYETNEKYIKFFNQNPDKLNKILETLNNRASSLKPYHYYRLNRLSVTDDLKNELKSENIVNNVMENVLNSNINEFIDTVHKYCPNFDPFLSLNFSDTIRSINLLRNELYNVQEGSISLDIKPNTEYSNNDDDFRLINSAPIAFKVTPYLNELTNNGLNESIPVLNFKIELDIKRLMIWMINRITFFEEKSKQTKEEFITFCLTKFNTCINSVSRMIILELVDMSNNIYSFWDNFNKKIDNAYQTLLNDDYIKNINNKIHFVYKNIFSDFDNDNELFNLENMFWTNSPTSKMFEKIYNCFSEDNIVSRNKILFVLYNNAFSEYFSNNVLLDYSINNSNNKDFKLQCYCREFCREYDKLSLLNKINILSNYNIRDFFQTIINELQCECHKHYIENMKESNGEHKAFLNSRFQREVHIDGLCLFYYYTKLKNCILKIDPENDPNGILVKMESVLNNLKRNIQSYIKYTITNEMSYCSTSYSNSSNFFNKIETKIAYINRYLDNTFHKDNLNYGETTFKTLLKEMENFATSNDSNFQAIFKGHNNILVGPISYDKEDMSKYFENYNNDKLDSSINVFDIYKDSIEPELSRIL